MVGRKRGDIPKSLERGRDRFEAWRRSRKVGARIPDELWSLAVTLAEAHGLSRTASALKLDYHGLKNRVAGRNCDSISGCSLPELSEARLMLQITPQMKILVAVESSGTFAW